MRWIDGALTASSRLALAAAGLLTFAAVGPMTPVALAGTAAGGANLADGPTHPIEPDTRRNNPAPAPPPPPAGPTHPLEPKPNRP